MSGGILWCSQLGEWATDGERLLSNETLFSCCGRRSSCISIALCHVEQDVCHCRQSQLQFLQCTCKYPSHLSACSTCSVAAREAGFNVQTLEELHVTALRLPFLSTDGRALKQWCPPGHHETNHSECLQWPLTCTYSSRNQRVRFFALETPSSKTTSSTTAASTCASPFLL